VGIFSPADNIALNCGELSFRGQQFRQSIVDSEQGTPGVLFAIWPKTYSVEISGRVLFRGY
jgi:hypothetical protein